MEFLSKLIPEVFIRDLPTISTDAPYWLMNMTSLKFEVPYLGKEMEIFGAFEVAVASIVLYLICIAVIFPLIKPSPQITERIAYWHFAALFLYSFFAFGSTLYHLFVNGELTNFEGLLCNPVPAWLRVISMSFTLSKVWEWVDTAIQLWRQKTSWGDFRKIDFLHTYHHATTLFLFLIVMNVPGTEKTGMLLNGFVHTLMYYHYGFRLPRSFRPIITAAQIVQLASVTIFHIQIPSYCPAFSDYPSKFPLEYNIVFAIVPVYLLFFIKFFVEQYICKKPSLTPKPITEGESTAVKVDKKKA